MATNVSDLLELSKESQNPLSALREFLDKEKKYASSETFEKMRLVGYALNIAYDKIRITTCDPFKINVGGIPRNSLLVMIPSNHEELPPHFTLLRVLEAADTPLSMEVQQTYFELQKKSMPELDIWTRNELQWGALDTAVLGMFYVNPDDYKTVEFSSDINNFVSADRYRIYAPDEKLLDIIINSSVPVKNRSKIGKLRLTECRLTVGERVSENVDVLISASDFMGTRTAMFGKTRLGKSNIVKLIAQSILEATDENKTEFIIDDTCIHMLKANPSKVPQELLDKLNSIKNKEYKGRSCFEEALRSCLSDEDFNRHSKTIFDHARTRVGQLIFDADGEYANDNPQDGNVSLRSIYADRCHVYALSRKEGTPSKSLRLNFYEQPEQSIEILRSLLEEDGRTAIYVKSFTGVEVPSLETIELIQEINEKMRAIRKLQIFWAILNKAGFDIDENELKKIAPRASRVNGFNPCINKEVRAIIHAKHETDLPEPPSTLQEMQREYELAADAINAQKELVSSSNNPLFDANDIALLKFLKPLSGSGPEMLKAYRIYHDKNASKTFDEVVDLLDRGETVILDLGNANEKVLKYYSKRMSQSVFHNQVKKFTENSLGKSYIQLYFEEAHTLFPVSSSDTTDVYHRFAKEGAKYHIGMVYSTQSPSSVSKELLAQTENFFVAHISSRDEVNALSKVNSAYEDLKEDILRAKSPGYVRVLTRSNRFVISVQANKFGLNEEGDSNAI